MGIRQMLQTFRAEEASRAPIPLTPAALDAIRKRLGEAEPGSLVFVIVTQPSPIGFHVGVGFGPAEGVPPHELRPEYPVPVRLSEEDAVKLAGTTIDFRDERFVSESDARVSVSETPNPDARTFRTNRRLVTEGSATFRRPADPEDPPLARLLFEVPGVVEIFFTKDFCTVTRAHGTAWETLAPEIGRRLHAFLAHGGEPMAPQPLDPASVGEVEARIRRLLDEVIRPSVQADGGDIQFAGYENGQVRIYMQGSCVGCPSARATLKMGVETLLKEEIPEVTEVVALE